MDRSKRFFDSVSLREDCEKMVESLAEIVGEKRQEFKKLMVKEMMIARADGFIACDKGVH